MGVVAKPGAVRLRPRRAHQRHGGGDSDGEDLGRAGEGGDEHGGALQREATLAKEKGAHVQLAAEDVEGWRDWRGSLEGSKAKDVVELQAWGVKADRQRSNWQPPRRWIARAARQPCDTGG
jgi:hypothetical protein